MRRCAGYPLGSCLTIIEEPHRFCSFCRKSMRLDAQRRQVKEKV